MMADFLFNIQRAWLLIGFFFYRSVHVSPKLMQGYALAHRATKDRYNISASPTIYHWNRRPPGVSYAWNWKGCRDNILDSETPGSKEISDRPAVEREDSQRSSYQYVANACASCIDDDEVECSRIALLPMPLGFLSIPKKKSKYFECIPKRKWNDRIERMGTKQSYIAHSIWRGYCSIPLMTRCWISASSLLSVLTASLPIPVAGSNQILEVETLAMHSSRFMRAFEFWRVLTGGLYQGPITLGTITRIYATMCALRQLEISDSHLMMEAFVKNPNRLSKYRQQCVIKRQKMHVQRQKLIRAECIDPGTFADISNAAHLMQFLIFQCGILSFFASALKIPFYGSSLTAATAYVLSRKDGNSRVPFILGISVPRWSLPFGLAAVDAVQAQTLSAAIPAALGICTGHAYYLLKKVLPAEFGLSVLPFPYLLCKTFLKFSKWRSRR